MTKTTVQAAPGAQRPPNGGSRRIVTPRTRIGRRVPGTGLISTASTLGLLLLAGLVWQLGSIAQWWSVATLPPFTQVRSELLRLLGTGEFWDDTGRTGMEIVLSLVAGTLLGLLAGILFWKMPIVGRILEPYLVSFYAVPLVLFYPVMIVITGITPWSVIILATVMAAIPMALNTWVGLATLRPVYLKLARSLGCTRRQTMLQVALPGAAPYIVAGLRLAAGYALIGAIAMEFTTASAGLGFRIRYLYESFETPTMFAYVLAVLGLSFLLTLLLALAEKRMLKGRNER
ncbi:ABC transporter permease [Streptomyces sp. 110]|uniref:ABC transporter permease n=1 Tax=Streptomyces endocoffeicus TaxID=2898945 RepID=A0ABS1PVK6_9ACTN|nr:ABC transporter permease [Streptomyces endocoffeicus]MBL1116453.1 ABC transporter permease [Streptomyces endocoffeicus]